MKVNYFNQSNQDVSQYIKILKKVFRKVKNNKNFNLVFINNYQIQELNLKYRNINKPTDVLSFVNDEDKKSIGDIFISVDKVKTQANEYNHSEQREVSFLAVHGYLHLSGYDHQTLEEEKEMNELTELILKKSKLERK